MRRLLAGIVLLATIASTGHTVLRRDFATARFAIPELPLLPGSRLSIALDGLQPPYELGVLGDGRRTGDLLQLPDTPGESTIVAANRDAVAERTINVVTPPDPARSFIAVASYDDGVVIHEPRAPFAMRSALAIGGAPADVAIDPAGLLSAATTNALSASIVRLAPWAVTNFAPVPFADELAFDAHGTLFVTNRDVEGAGALTRIARDGHVTQRVLGLTAEGLAVDNRRGLVYVANVNDGTISVVDSTSLVELRRIHAVDRVFSLVLSPSGSTLYAVSNQSLTSPFGHAGSVVAIDLANHVPHVMRSSGPLTFPVAAALDSQRNRLFVTDEHDDDVYVLDGGTLRAVHAPLATCRTPWKPSIDDGRLYVPCARADEVDVFDLRTLRRIHGAPFRTGGYPLAVAVWHPLPGGKHPMQ